MATFTLQINQGSVADALRREYPKRFAAILGIDDYSFKERLPCSGDDSDSFPQQAGSHTSHMSSARA